MIRFGEPKAVSEVECDPVRDAIGAPRLVSNGELRLVVWVHAGHALLAAPLALDDRFDRHSPQVLASGGRIDSFDIATDGRGFLVAWSAQLENGPGARWLRLDGEGRVIGDTSRPFEQPSCLAPQIASNGTQYVIAWNDWRDDTCLRILPLASDGSPIDDSPIDILNSDERVCRPTIASNGDNFLLAWQKRGPGKAIHIYCIDADGTPVGSPLEMPSLGRSPDCPRIASDGRDYLVVWEETAPGFRDVRAARVDGQMGAILDDSSFVVDAREAVKMRPDVVFDGSKYLVTWSETPRDREWAHIHVRMIDPGDPSRRGSTHYLGASFIGSEEPAGIACDAGGRFVVWQGGVNPPYDMSSRMFAAYLDEQGVPVADESPRLPTMPIEQDDPDVAVSDHGIVAVWQGGRGAEHLVFARRFDHAGNAIDRAPIKLGVSNNGQAKPRVASNGEVYVTVWTTGPTTESRVLASFLSASVEDAAPSEPVRLTGALSPGRMPTITSDGTDFLVAWAGLRPEALHQGDLYGVLLDGQAREAKGGVFQMYKSDHFPGQPRLTSNGSAYLVVWLESGGRLHAATFGSLGEPLAGPVQLTESGQNVASPSVGCCRGGFLVAWAGGGWSELSIRAVRLGGRGELLDRTPSVLTEPIRGSIRSTDVASIGAQAVILWERADYIPPPAWVRGLLVECEETPYATEEPFSLAVGGQPRLVPVHDDRLLAIYAAQPGELGHVRRVHVSSVHWDGEDS